MIATYCTKEELKPFEMVADKELDELLQEVRQTFGNRYFLRAREHVTRRFLRKAKREMLYEVLVDLGGGEVQVMNFKREWDWSINTAVPAPYVYAFFYGLFNGANYFNLRADFKPI